MATVSIVSFFILLLVLCFITLSLLKCRNMNLTHLEIFSTELDIQKESSDELSEDEKSLSQDLVYKPILEPCSPIFPAPNNKLESVWNFGNPDLSVYESRLLSKRELDLNNTKPGGFSTPEGCIPLSKVAVLIPFRGADPNNNKTSVGQSDRVKQLKFNIPNMFRFMQEEQLEFQIYVIEQSWTTKFNRAKLLNIGFENAMKQHNFDCFIIHDVDRVPIDHKISYRCHRLPFHYTTDGIFGGISQIPTDTIKAINGFSNLFFGWGGEDTEMARRLSYAFRLTNQNLSLAKFKFNPFKKSAFGSDNMDAWLNLDTNKGNNKDAGNEKNPDWQKMARNISSTYDIDGLSTLSYKLVKTTIYDLYTNILVDFDYDDGADRVKIDNDPMILGHPCLKNVKSNQKCLNDKGYI